MSSHILELSTAGNWSDVGEDSPVKSYLVGGFLFNPPERYLSGWLGQEHRSIWGFPKMVVPNNHGFPTKNDHFEVLWGYHHLRKHPYRSSHWVQVCILYLLDVFFHQPI